MYSPVKGARVSSNYKGGFRSSGGHSGIDFAAPIGTPIYAVAGGTVISTSNSGAYGRLTKVRHDDGSIGYYAHQSRYAVKPGQRINPGGLLGYVGSTGNSTGPHLHFEVRIDGQPTNPGPWLESASGVGKKGGVLSKSDFKSGGAVERYEMPDVVQYRNPTDLLATLTQQAQQIAPMSKAGGGFDTPGLDTALESLGQRMPYDMDKVRDDPMTNPLLHRGMPQPVPKMVPIGAPPQAEGALGSHSHGGGASGDLGALISAIKGQESGGNYNARNSSSGALGAYQIMPANIPSWSKAALGYSISAQQFVNNPALQDKIARHRLGMYFKKYGAAGAALAWYAGEGALRYSDSTRNRAQGKYPSMNSYVRQVLERAGL